MARHVFTNNAATTLSLALPAGSTLMQLASSSKFAGSVYPDLVQAMTISDPANVLAPEIVYAIGSPDSNQRTVIRAREGTAARAWPSGSIVSARITAGMLGSFPQVVDGALSLTESHRGRNWLGGGVLQVGGFPVLQRARVLPGAGANLMDPNLSREIIGATVDVHLGPVSAWAADTTYYAYATVEPPTPNGLQYYFHPESRLGATSNTTTPPAFGADVVPALDGSTEVGYWLPVDRTNLRQKLPSYAYGWFFVPTEFGFSGSSYGSGSVPTVSVGTETDPTRFASGVPLSQINGYACIHRIPVDVQGSVNFQSLVFRCDTPSSEEFSGRFYWKGFFIES